MSLHWLGILGGSAITFHLRLLKISHKICSKATGVRAGPIQALVPVHDSTLTYIKGKRDIRYADMSLDKNHSVLDADRLRKSPKSPASASAEAFGNVYRRSHTKSRNGCLLCKARKTKCGEEKPRCLNCVRRGNACRYAPGDPSGNPKRKRTSPTTSDQELTLPGSSLVSPTYPVTFTGRDMRYLHHFLTSLSHPLPLGNELVWRNEIPQIAHQHQFLMHAMLALGASELGRADPQPDFEYEALRHRVIAIAGLKKAFKEDSILGPDGRVDAILATCYALIYQSTHKEDAFNDFQVLVRGLALVTEDIRGRSLKSALNVTVPVPEEKFGADGPENSTALIAFPQIPVGIEAINEILDAFQASNGRAFGLAVRDTLELLIKSPAEAHVHSALAYGSWYNLAIDLVAALQGPQDGKLALSLVACFLSNMVLIHVLVPMSISPGVGIGSCALPYSELHTIAEWFEAIERVLEVEYHQYLRWSKLVAELMLAHSQPGVALRNPVGGANVGSMMEILADLNTK